MYPLVLSEVEGRPYRGANEAPMSFWVYMLKCRDGSYYAGHTDDLESRLWQHQQGTGADWTRRRRPVELAWCELMPTRDEAFAAERMIKKWTVAKKEALIAGNWGLISYLAKPPRERQAEHTGADGNEC